MTEVYYGIYENALYLYYLIHKDTKEFKKAKKKLNSINMLNQSLSKYNWANMR